MLLLLLLLNRVGVVCIKLRVRYGRRRFTLQSHRWPYSRSQVPSSLGAPLASMTRGVVVFRDCTGTIVLMLFVDHDGNPESFGLELARYLQVANACFGCLVAQSVPMLAISYDDEDEEDSEASLYLDAQLVQPSETELAFLSVEVCNFTYEIVEQSDGTVTLAVSGEQSDGTVALEPAAFFRRYQDPFMEPFIQPLLEMTLTVDTESFTVGALIDVAVQHLCIERPTIDAHFHDGEGADQTTHSDQLCDGCSRDVLDADEIARFAHYRNTPLASLPRPVGEGARLHIDHAYIHTCTHTHACVHACAGEGTELYAYVHTCIRACAGEGTELHVDDDAAVGSKIRLIVSHAQGPPSSPPPPTWLTSQCK